MNGDRDRYIFHFIYLFFKYSISNVNSKIEPLYKKREQKHVWRWRAFFPLLLLLLPVFCLPSHKNHINDFLSSLFLFRFLDRICFVFLFCFRNGCLCVQTRRERWDSCWWFLPDWMKDEQKEKIENFFLFKRETRGATFDLIWNLHTTTTTTQRSSVRAKHTYTLSQKILVLIKTN